MGFFDKFKKDYSMYDCSNRPVSWFMGAEGREAFSVYVFNCEEDCLRWWKAGYDVNPAPIAYGNMLKEISSSAGKDVQEMVKAAKKAAAISHARHNIQLRALLFCTLFHQFKITASQVQGGRRVRGGKVA